MAVTRRKLAELSDRLVLEISYLYVKKGWRAIRIADHLKVKYPEESAAFRLNNERIVSVLNEAIERGMVVLLGRDHEETAERIQLRYHTIVDESKTVRVVDVGGELMRASSHTAVSRPSDVKETVGGKEFETSPVVDQIAHAAAEEVLELIRRLGSKRGRVRIGLGAGHTAQSVVRRLGKLIRHDRDCPPLALHALTPGFSLDPLQSPVTYFRFFEKSVVDVEYVGLSTLPFVDVADLKKLYKEPEFAAAAELAREIDIVVTSLAQASDEDGMLKRYLQKHYPDTYEKLKEKDWKGDVQFCPYNDEPLELDEGVRAVSLLNLHDLCAITAAPNKFVVLVAGPCNACGELKTEAIEPLLTQPSLNVWTHMVTDIESAEELTRVPPRANAAVLAPTAKGGKKKGGKRKKAPKRQKPR